MAGRAGNEAPMTTPINSADPGHWAAQQAAAEAGAEANWSYYEAKPGEGVPIVTGGSDPQPLAVTEAAPISGTPWDQQ